MKRTYDYILIDLDGTVIDSKPGIHRCIKMALDAKGVPYTQAILDKMIGPPFRWSMKNFFNLEGDVVEDFIKIYRGEYDIRGWKECNVYDGVVEMLRDLKAAGKKVALATSKPLKFSSTIINGLDLAQYFDYVGGATDDSSGETKADVIYNCFDALGIKDKSKAIMVGDRLFDIEGAKECGIDSIGILWGYGDREELQKYEADYILETPKDVVDFLV